MKFLVIYKQNRVQSSPSMTELKYFFLSSSVLSESTYFLQTFLSYSVIPISQIQNDPTLFSLISSNFAEILSVGIAAILNLPSPLLPLQILFLNVITDIFPALALGFGKGEKDIMQLPPKNPKEPIMTKVLWQSTLIYGLAISASVLGITAYSYFILEFSALQINNLAFYTLIAAQLLNVFNMPARHLSFFKNEVTTNPWVWGAIALCVGLTLLAYKIPFTSKALNLIQLTPSNIFLIVLFSFGSLALAQLVKRLGGTV